jgi:hypothetical protein
MTVEPNAVAVDKRNYVISQPSHHLDGSWTRALMMEEAQHSCSHKSAIWGPVTHKGE